MKHWIASVLTAGLVVASAETAMADRDRYNIGEEIPTFTLKALNGDILGESYISVDRYFGAAAKEPKKVLLLSFFASYCEPCKREMPLLAALYEAYKGKGLQVVLVSIDTDPEKIEVAKTLAKDNGVKFPVLSDRFNIVAKRYFVAKLPNSYLVSGEGKVVMANVGYNEDISKRMVDEIRKGVGEATSEPVPEAITKHMGQTGAPEAVNVKSDSGTTEPTTVDSSNIPPPAGAGDTDTKTKVKTKTKTKKTKGRSK